MILVFTVIRLTLKPFPSTVEKNAQKLIEAEDEVQTFGELTDKLLSK
jgi:hypothetical protein